MILLPHYSFATAVPLAAALLLGATAIPAQADLVLNEVLYDPSGSDEGNEFVELWNPDSVPRALTGIVVEAADGSGIGAWAPIFRGSPGDSIPPRGVFLAAGVQLAAAMQNGPDAVRLARDGIVLDRLGYGELGSSALFEGSPAPDVPSGHSLARRGDGVDSDRNADDWEDEPRPTPGRANHPDERLELADGEVQMDPIVPWPGETVVVTARVHNRGRLPLDGSRWRLMAEWQPIGGREAHAGGLPILHDGVGLAPGESTAISLSMDGIPEGPFRVLVWIASADGNPFSADLADTSFALGRARASPAVINEIAFRSDGAGEWVELWLREAVADVSLFSIADQGSIPHPIFREDVARPLPAGAFLVIAQNPQAVRDRYGLDSSLVVGIQGAWPSLNDTPGPNGWADIVRVTDEAGVPCDVVPYVARSSSRGGSLERLSADLPGHLSGSWGECIDPSRGTPGRANSLRAPDREGSGRGTLIIASARVLRRDVGFAPLLLRLTAEARGRSIVVRVMDLLGRPVRTLVQGQRFESEGAFAWDGRDGAGSWVPPGLYVITAETMAESGPGPRRSSIPIAVSAGRIAP